MVASRFDNIGFMSADVLREAGNDKSNPYCELINSHINSGTIVPGFITAAALENELNVRIKKIDRFLVDGFPRTVDNLESFRSEFTLTSK